MRIGKVIVITCLLFASCNDTKIPGDSDIIDLNLEAGLVDFNLVDCFHKWQPNSRDLDDPYYDQCLLPENISKDRLKELKDKIILNLESNGWALSETIEKTKIFRKTRPYDKCTFTIQVSFESPDNAVDYFDSKTKNQIYTGSRTALIITRFSEPLCS